MRIEIIEDEDTGERSGVVDGLGCRIDWSQPSADSREYWVDSIIFDDSSRIHKMKALRETAKATLFAMREAGADFAMINANDLTRLQVSVLTDCAGFMVNTNRSGCFILSASLNN
ncbi:MAG: hypothetical protein ACRCWB_11685 [Enterovibrio sp.]